MVARRITGHKGARRIGLGRLGLACRCTLYVYPGVVLGERRRYQREERPGLNASRMTSSAIQRHDKQIIAS
jgi:hypothetical protein